MESEPMLTPRGKNPVLETQRRIEPMTLHHAGQWAQHATNLAILAPIPDIDWRLQGKGKAKPVSFI